MVAYSFKARFEGKLRSGDKVQTIRALGRRRHARPGEMVQVYIGMRTKACRLLFQSPCVEVLPIAIAPSESVTLGDRVLSPGEVEALAGADGFEGVDEFMAFFRDRLPFEGVLIKWQPVPF